MFLVKYGEKDKLSVVPIHLFFSFCLCYVSIFTLTGFNNRRIKPENHSDLNRITGERKLKRSINLSINSTSVEFNASIIVRVFNASWVVFDSWLRNYRNSKIHDNFFLRTRFLQKNSAQPFFHRYILHGKSLYWQILHGEILWSDSIIHYKKCEQWIFRYYWLYTTHVHTADPSFTQWSVCIYPTLYTDCISLRIPNCAWGTLNPILIMYLHF